MFNPESTLDIEQLAKLAGSFIKEADIQPVKSLLQAEVKMVETAFFNLYSAQSLRFLKSCSGVVEGDFEVELIKDKNCKAYYLQEPRPIATAAAGSDFLVYKVTSYNLQGETLGSRPVKVRGSFPVQLEWEQVYGAVGYKIYRNSSGFKLIGETTSLEFSDSNLTPTEAIPLRNTALSYYSFKEIPLLDYLYITEFQALVGSPSYQVKRGELQVFAPEWFQERGELKNRFKFKYLAVYPLLSFTLYPQFNLQIDRLLQKNRFIPYIYNWDYTAEEAARARGRHLVYFIWGAVYLQQKAPTLKTLSWLWSLLCGIPFAYEGGEVIAVTSGRVTIKGEQEITYSLNSFDQHEWQIGETVQQFQPLLDLARVDDLYTNSAKIDEMESSLFPGKDKQMMLALSTDLMYQSQEATDFFIQKNLPAGLLTGLLLPPPAAPINLSGYWIYI